MSYITIETEVDIDIDDYLHKVDTETLIHELQYRGELPTRNESMDSMNNQLMTKIYDYLNYNCHTYNDVMRIEGLLGIS